LDAGILAAASEATTGLGEFLWTQFHETPWRFWEAFQWRDFWLRLILDDRYLVCYFLPLLPVLMLLRQRHLRIGIVVTCLIFLTYVFGLFYALFWLGMCVLFHRLGEQFAVEAKRTDVIRWGPPLAAGACIVGWCLFTDALQHVGLPDQWNQGLFAHARGLFPLGARALWWEPRFVEMYVRPDAADPTQMFRAIFWNPHNIGTAYFTIRMLQYFSEIKRDGIPRARRTLLNFLAFVCYAPTLMQGPIERYKEFQDEMDTCHQRRGWHNVPPAFARIAWGIIKSLLVVRFFGWVLYFHVGVNNPDVDFYAHPERAQSYAVLYFAVFLQIWCLYLEFSGYCDVAAGMSRLLGYRLIENFNWPWLATSMRDFWRRWHISLSFMLRDYVYIPLGGNRRHAALNVVITFLLIGAWHAPTKPQVTIWGIVMGLMVVVNQQWVAWMKSIEAAPATRLAAIRRGVRKLRPLPQICSWALTMNAFCLSLLIFFGGSGAIRVVWELIRRPAEWLVQAWNQCAF
jgi:D-alanyl-lipoteichoic acid acyltransferase DltB (MBOAT superfamily)